MATDQDLIDACRVGRTEAWDEVYRRYHRLIRSIARSYGASESDAEELVQITFSILHSSIARLEPGSRLAPWLSTVARRHTWRLLEKRRREAPIDIQQDTAIHEALVHDDVRDAARRSAEDEVLRAALRRVPSRCRALLEALYLRESEPGYAEISAEFDIPIGSIGPTRSRCLDKLRQILADLDAGEHDDMTSGTRGEPR